MVDRIFWHGVDQMQPILGLLRQQMFFNELVASCFSDILRYGTVDTHTSATGGTRRVEVSVHAPTRVTLRFVERKSLQLMDLDILIALHGVNHVRFRRMPSSFVGDQSLSDTSANTAVPPFSLAQLSRLPAATLEETFASQCLDVTHSIPVLLTHF
jgi:hypothetical protein